MVNRFFLGKILALSLLLTLPHLTPAVDKKSVVDISLQKVRDFLLSKVEKKEDYPSTIGLDSNTVEVQYTIDGGLTSFVKNLLKKNSSDYVSVVVIDNETGNILSALDYNKKDQKFGTQITFSNTHPAASLFKVVTTAELLQNTRISRNSLFEFSGKATTLYKHQLKGQKGHYSKSLTLDRAFAQSNNVIFGKAAIENILGVSIYRMATDFGFNQSIIPGMDLKESAFEMPEDQYDLAQIASGFNQKTLMSPIHGALMASVVANDGLMKFPSLVSALNVKGEAVWRAPAVKKNVLTKEVARDLMEMMALTVEDGTAKKSFKRDLLHFPFNKLHVGGKTGSITGGEPYGKRDWFIAYAVPKDEKLGKGISLCVMVINVKKWYVKASYLAKNIIEHYYKESGPFREKI